MKRLLPLLLLPALAAPAETAREAWAGLLSAKSKKQAAYAWVENDPKLPNVFIYGDSISIGYTPNVRENLEGKANVYRLHTNGGDSSSFIDKVEGLHKTMRNPKLEGHWDFKWDLIQVNVGLHDLKYVIDGKLDITTGTQVSSHEVYAKNLAGIFDWLEKNEPQAKIIFALTTPVPENSGGRKAGDAAAYNKVARSAIGKRKVVINDLYTLVKPNQSKWWTRPGNVHFNADGNEALGKQVSETILQALQKK